MKISIKHRKGIEPVIAIIFLIIATIAAGGVMYAIMSGWLGSMMKVVGIRASGELLGGTNNGYLNVKNTGNVELYVNSITISGLPTGTTITLNPSLPIKLNAGDSASVSISIDAGAQFVTGNTYTILITYAADGSTYNEAFKITAS
jgi:hypothetical protein